MNLLWDSARKYIDITLWFKEVHGVFGWRKGASWKRSIKIISRISSKTSSSGGKNKEERLQAAVSHYIKSSRNLETKVIDLLKKIVPLMSISAITKRLELEYYHGMLIKHIDLLERGLLKGEVIPSSEKLYSIFETHCEWLTKGKKINPVEIGHNVLISNDKFRFVIHHQDCEKQTDVSLTKGVALKLVAKYTNGIGSLSFDKGFYSKENKAYVEKLIPQVIMPKKGKRNKEETLEEGTVIFKKLRNAHSAVESNINQLRA
jgi:hypothetical protein